MFRSGRQALTILIFTGPGLQKPVAFQKMHVRWHPSVNSHTLKSSYWKSPLSWMIHQNGDFPVCKFLVYRGSLRFSRRLRRIQESSRELKGTQFHWQKRRQPITRCVFFVGKYMENIMENIMEVRYAISYHEMMGILMFPTILYLVVSHVIMYADKHVHM